MALRFATEDDESNHYLQSPTREIGRRFCQLEAITENDPIPYTLFTIVQHAYIFTEVHSIAFPSKY